MSLKQRVVPANSNLLPKEAWQQIGRHLRLSSRELQIVRGVFDDRTEFAIAADLGISTHTVHTHVERLHHKLAVPDRVAMVLRVMEAFLQLTRSPTCGLPPICANRATGRCPFPD